MTNKKQIIIISKYFLPYPSVDSNSVYDMCLNFLKINPDLEINIITTNSEYKTANSVSDYNINILNKLKIHYVKSWTRSKYSSIINFSFGLIDSINLLYCAKKMRINKIISLSNPPLIIMFANFLLRKRNFYYWSFDLFPDAFVSEGLMKETNFLYKTLEYFTYNYQPYSIIALGEKQFDYLQNKFRKQNINKIILPCGIHQNIKSRVVPNWFKINKIIIGYIGNIGRAHHLDFLINVMNVLSNNDEFVLVLSVYGHNANIVKEHFKLLKASNIKLIDTLKQNELSYIDIHLVSLKESWTHISVPSKAVSAICAERTLWFCGSKTSDTYNMFKECSFISEFDTESVQNTINSITIEVVNKKKINASQIAKQLVELEFSSYCKILS